MNDMRVNVTKRGKVYQYKFEIAKINVITICNDKTLSPIELDSFFLL